MFLQTPMELRAPTKGSLAYSPVSVFPGTWRAFKYFLFAVVSLAIAAASLENGLHPLVLLILPLVFMALTRGDYREPFLWSEETGTVVFLLYVPASCLLMYLLRASVSLPFFIVYFTFGILVVRVLSPLTDRNIWQLIFLSIGLVLINCILTNHVVFGLLLPGYVFCLMAALLLFHLARHTALSGRSSESEAPNIVNKSRYASLAKYSLFVVFATIVFFVFLPRPFLVIPGFTAAMAKAGGLSDLEQQIRYRGTSGTAGNQRIAFRVTVTKGVLPDFPYWRGRVLEKTDGQGWYAVSQVRGMGRLIKPGGAPTVRYQIMPYKLQSNVVHAFGLPVWALGHAGRPLYVTSNAEIVIDTPFLVSDYYDLNTVDLPIPATVKPRDANLSKEGVSQRIAHLAAQWTARFPTPRDKAGILVSRLKGEFKYVLQNPVPPPDAHPIEHFLFESQMGNCEYFAGALCLMLRSVGIPARVVEGFAGAERTDQPGEFIVRFSRAHAWVEAVLDGKTWTSLDATPARRDLTENHLLRLASDAYDQLEYNWIKYVVYFDRADQANMLRSVRQLFEGELPIQVAIRSKIGSYSVALFIAAVLLFIIVLWSYRYFAVSHGVAAVYGSAMNRLVKKGILSRVHSWHELNSAEILANDPALKDPLAAFMDTYLKGRFGSDPAVSKEDLKKAKRNLIKLAKKSTQP